MEIKQEEINLENLEVGEDVPQMGAKMIEVMELKQEPVNKDGKLIGNKLKLMVKHPDATDLIEISGVKYTSKDKIKTSGLWIKLDKDRKLPYKSAVASLLRHFGISKVAGLKGAKLPTIEDDNGYLAIKAY